MGRDPDRAHEELLVMRSQASDAEAFEALARLWYPRLWRFARSTTEDDDGAAEVAQESFIAIVKGIARLDDPARFRPWAYRIARNKCADWTRTRQRQRRLAADHTQIASLAAEIAARSSQQVELVRDALLRLAPDRHSLLELRYAHGLSNAEIASVLEVPEGTVKSRLHHAREELKRAMEENEDD